jgi:PhzF family phenazine biosynthesis protein
MPYFQSIHCDVFAPRIGTGNPLAVILDADSLSTEQMQAIASWMNLAETTFIVKPNSAEADYRVRIFTTQKEIAFAGHPSIGSAHVLLSHGLQPKTPSSLMQECAAGLLPIRYQPELRNNTLSVRVPSSKLLRFADNTDTLFNLILAGTDFAEVKPALVEGGRRWWLAELQNEQDVRQFVPDSFAIKQLAEQTQSLGLCIFARRQTPASGLVVRAFPLGVGIFEDPASGAANAAIAAFLQETGQLHHLGNHYLVSQGREIGRDAVLSLDIDSNNDVWVGGDCQNVVEGRLQWPKLK